MSAAATSAALQAATSTSASEPAVAGQAPGVMGLGSQGFGLGQALGRGPVHGHAVEVLSVVIERVQGHDAQQLDQCGLAVALGKKGVEVGLLQEAAAFHYVAGEYRNSVRPGVGSGLLAQGHGLGFGQAVVH